MREGVQVGAYRVISQIGEGGMGTVWLAEHVQLGRRAALKVLRPEYSTRNEIVQRFFNEARAATSIQDPGIVQVFDFGQDATGAAYIVMELLDGEPLDKRLHRQGALQMVDALRIMRQVSSTLGAAHQRGIIHRDLKPENIFMVRDPEVASGERAKILDFGIAKLVGDGHVKTQTSAVMGTPTYMSPEQCRGAGQVDQRSDVYALGCVLFTLLVGRPPFDAAGMGEIIVMHMTHQPPAPSMMRGGIPPEVDQLVLRCLEKDPARRFSSAAELAVALGTLLGSSPRHDTGPAYAVSPSQIATKPTTLSSASGVTGAPVASRSRFPIIAGVSVLVAGVAIVGILVAGGKKETKQAQNDIASNAPIAPATTPPPPPPVVIDAAPAAPDPKAQVKAQIVQALQKFVAWSKDKAGAPCPDLATLNAADADAWGHPLSITCTDQPGNQIVGIISLGPDGQLGTADDVASWELDNDVTSLVRGARWKTDAVATKTTKTTTTKQTTTKPKDGTKTTKQGPKIELDENGLPISR